MEPIEVVVIGAGLAGLTAAYRLQQKGIDVHVYEARGRVGGRIFSAWIRERSVEIGGLNINDGGVAENIHRLVKELGLSLVSNTVDFNHHYFNGEKFFSVDELLNNSGLNQETLKKDLDDVAAYSKNMREVLLAFFKEDNPLYKVLSLGLSAYEGAPIEKLSPVYAETLYFMLSGGMSAAHPAQEEHDVEFLRIQGGNSLLPEKIAHALGERVHLNMPLISVSKSEGRYLLTFQNGKTIKASKIILAMPCSVYQDIAFEEGIIPKKRFDAIRKVQYGMNAKVLIPFPPSNLKRIGFINEQALAIYDPFNQILILYYTEESSRFTPETLLENYLKDLPMLKMGFGEIYPANVRITYARDEAFVHYDEAIGYSWPNDPYARGSYSSIKPGQEAALLDIREENGETVKTLFAPIDQRLYFAGEHASILMDVPGTMEAACESGERAARMIASQH